MRQFKRLLEQNPVLLGVLLSLLYIPTQAQVTANFSADTVTSCNIPHIVQFTSTSTGPIISYHWDFGNGLTSPQQNPSTVYGSPGNYNVRLIVSDGLNKDTLERISYIKVSGAPPDAQFDTPSPIGCTPLTAPFNNTSTNGFSYLWDFGDGTTSTLSNPTHTYNTAGAYDVKLYAYFDNGNNGCVDSLVRTNYIQLDDYPNILSVSSISTITCQNVHFPQFSANFTGSPTVWSWDFGDGQTSNIGPMPFHIYTGYGVYDVTVTAETSLGCRDSLFLANHIQLIEPQVAFEPNNQAGCAPFAVEFADSSIVGDSIISWEWHFGDGTTSTLQHPNHTYSDTGSFDVTLIINTSTSCADTLTQLDCVTVYPAVQGVDFVVIPQIACAIDPIVFFNTSNVIGSMDWTWDVGDGTTKSGLNASHFYQDTGSFHVTLIAESEFGCTDTITYPNAIQIIEPVALFDVSPPISCTLPATVQFTDQSLGADTWTWDFGDSTSSTLQNPTHTYTQAGSYTVILRVYNASTDCDDEAEFVITIPEPEADFIVANPNGCTDFTVFFGNDSRDTETYQWDFGDGNTSTDENPSHTYTQAGVYNIRLVATDSLGCSDTLSRANYVQVGSLHNDFTANATQGCTPLEVSFIETATIAPIGVADIETWLWDFGDGNIDTSKNPVHTYTEPGSYTVTLYLQNRLGCWDTLSRIDYIQAWGPLTHFAPDQTADCAPISINFTDSSTVYPTNGSIQKWNWTFGDGGQDSVQHPLYTYLDPGLYSVSLIVTDNLGCKDSLELPDLMDICTPLATAFSCDSLYNCSIGSLGDVDIANADTGDALVWDGSMFRAMPIGTGGTGNTSSIWQLNGSDTYYNTGKVGIGTDLPNAQVDIQATSLGDNPALRISASDNNAPNGYTLELKGHPSAGGNGHHVQLSTASSDSRLTLKAGADNDFAPRLQMTGAAEPSSAGWAIFDYGSYLEDLPNASFKMRFIPQGTAPIDMIHAEGEEGVYLVPTIGKVGIGTQTPEALLHVAGAIRSDALAGGGNVMADANGNLILGNAQSQDTDSTNELIESITLSGSLLEVVEAGTSHSIDLSPLSNITDNDWAFVGTNNNLASPIYHLGEVGIGTSSPTAKLEVQNGSVLFAGSIGTTPVSGAGTRMMWVPEKAAFRAGAVWGNQWDDTEIGAYSSALGLSSIASGAASTALGRDNFATGIATTCIGRENTASANGATAIGRNNQASGEGATALGFSTIAAGFAGTTMGISTQALGDFSLAMGSSTIAIGFNSVATGLATIAEGNYATAMGQGTEAAGDNSTAMGLSTRSSVLSLAIGRYNDDMGASSTWNAHEYAFTIGDGIDSLNRSNSLYVKKNGDLWIQGNLSQFSDIRLKNHIRPLTNVLDKLSQLNGVQYRWKDAEAMGSDEEIGLIAQEVEAVYPELIEEVEGYKAVNYIGLIPVLIEATKTQQQTISNQEQLLAQQQQVIQDLQSQMHSIQSLLDDLGLTQSPPTPSKQNVSDKPNNTQEPQLFQNLPNPFTETTSIPYYLPSQTAQAQLLVFQPQSGKVLRVFELRDTGYGNIDLPASQLATGVYAYSLYVNGKCIGTRRMVLVD